MKNQMYIALLVLPLLAGCGNKKEAAHTMPAPEISVSRPSIQDITLTKNYPGYLTSEKTLDLVGRVSGPLQTVAYTPGSRVHQGQVLFQIEPTVYQDNVRQAEAALNTARANLEYAQNNYARMQEAAKTDAVSQKHHFYAFNHAGGNLFQAIHSGKGTEYGTGIYQNLRIRSVQSIDADLLETTILAVCLYTYTGLKVQPLR